MKPTRLFLAFFLVSLALCMQQAAYAAANTKVTVTNLSDDGRVGSLRGSIARIAPGGTINFAPGLSGTITLSEVILIDKSINLAGPGSNLITISGSNKTRVFFVLDRVQFGDSQAAVTVCKISDLTIADGNGAASGRLYAKRGTTTFWWEMAGWNGYGGAIYIYGGTLMLNRCRIVNSSAENDGGGICQDDSGKLYLTDSTFDKNSASYGGGLYAWDGTVTAMRCTFSNNTGDDDGGGVCSSSSDFKAEACTFDKNSASYGGGLYAWDGTATATRCTFSNNTGDDFGGGVCNSSSDFKAEACTFDKNSASYGGGLCAWGDMTATRCTFSGNSAGTGGGVYNSSGNFQAETCTFSGNSAENGGGIYNGSTTHIIASTITGNEASNSGGGIYTYSEFTATVRNTIIINNKDHNASNDLTSGGSNIFPAGYSGTLLSSDQRVDDAKLGPLANNGGPTKTHALLPGSPAIDPDLDKRDTTLTGTDGTCATDQRGMLRKIGAAVDIGAYEAPFVSPSVATGEATPWNPQTAYAGLGVPAIAGGTEAIYSAFAAKAGGLSLLVSGSVNLSGSVALSGTAIKQRDAVPGVADAIFAGFQDPVVDQYGHIAFIASLSGSGVIAKKTDMAIFSDVPDGTLRMVARTGTGNAPGTLANFEAFQALSLVTTSTTESEIVYKATLRVDKTNVTNKSNTGIWSHVVAAGGTSAHLLVRTGTAMPTTSGTITMASLNAFVPTAGTQGQGRAHVGAGVVTFQAILADKPKTQVLIDVNPVAPDPLTILTQSGTSAASLLHSTQLPSAKWVSMGQAINDRAPLALAVLGTVQTSSTTTTTIKGKTTTKVTYPKFTGVFFSKDGTGFEPLALVGGTTANAQGIPVPGVTYASFKDPVMDADTDAVAFQATMKGANSHTGIWWSGASGTAKLVAETGVQIPGMAKGLKFNSFNSLALPPGGHTGPVFVATLSEIDAGMAVPANASIPWVSLWVVNSDNTLSLLFSTREFSVSGSGAVKTVKSIDVLNIGTAPTTPGVTRSFADGVVTFRATFEDGSQAIMYAPLE